MTATSLPQSQTEAIQKEKQNATWLFATFIGGALIFNSYLARWFFEQRESEATGVTCMNTEVMLQTTGMLLVLARITLRNRFRLGMIHRNVPVTVGGEIATHEVEI